MNILNLSDAPDNPVERIAWLTKVADEVKAELDQHYKRAYFEARLQGMLDAALAVHAHSRKQVLAWTRELNRARMVRWNDGADPTSSAYDG